MAQEMRIDPLGDACACGGFLHALLDPSRGVSRVARGCKQWPGRAIPQRRPELLGECRSQWERPLLAALGVRNAKHLLVKKHLLDLQMHKLGHPGAHLEQRLDQEHPATRHPVGGVCVAAERKTGKLNLDDG
jgi:hypothetical protein